MVGIPPCIYTTRVAWWGYPCIYTTRVCSRCTSLYIPTLYTPGYTTSCTYPVTCTSVLHRVRDEDALGAKKEKPLGREASARLKPLFLSGLVGNSARCYSCSRAKSVGRSDRRRVYPYWITLGLGHVAQRGAHPAIRSLIVDHAGMTPFVRPGLSTLCRKGGIRRPCDGVSVMLVLGLIMLRRLLTAHATRIIPKVLSGSES